MKLKHVYLTSDDPERLSQFYAKLGFTVRFADANRWIQFKTEGAAFCIASPEESAGEISGNAIAVFEVDDLESTLETARNEGAISVGQVRDMGAHGRVALVQDAGHNIVQFFQSKPGQPQSK
jgi:predicted enzyme related to lactoylglutathione lyase